MTLGLDIPVLPADRPDAIISCNGVLARRLASAGLIQPAEQGEFYTAPNFDNLVTACQSINDELVQKYPEFVGAAA